VRVEVDAQAVDAAIDAMIKNFQKESSFPGFRAGKAPRDIVLKKHEKDIMAEAKRKLTGDSYKAAIAEQKLRIVGYPDLEDIQFGKGQALQFAATVEVEPDFELPEYKGLPARRETTEVTPADVDRAIDMLREQQAAYNKVEREAIQGDVAVLNYSGTSEGKPLTEISPASKGLEAKQGSWMLLQPGQFIPGFTEQLIGSKAGDKRTVTVTFPADFVAPALAGKPAEYAVEVVEVREKNLPELTEELAKTLGAESIEKLREGVRTDLQNELLYKKRQDVRNQVVEELLKRVGFDLPEGLVHAETRNVVYNIVAENQRRGVGKDLIDQQKDHIFKAAKATAEQRVKADLIFARIAEKEGVKPTEEELNYRIMALADRAQVPAKKYIDELVKRNGVNEVYDQLLAEKIIDFLVEFAKVEDVAPAATPA
jgi:trigger factor